MEYLFIFKDGANTFGRINNYSQYISANIWAHVIVVYDGNGSDNEEKLRAYIDNSEITLTYNEVIPSATGDYSAGSFAFSLSGEAVNGLIDDVRIYNRALTSNEVNAIWSDTKDDH